VRHLRVKDLGVVEEHVLRHPEADRDFALDRNALGEVVSEVRAGGVHIEVDFLVAVSTAEEDAAHGKPADLHLSRSDVRLLRSGGRRSCKEQDQNPKR
jgi:hypothetical protein